MKNNKIPYKSFERLVAWPVIEDAIKSLVDNKDIIEQTDRRYIVGYLVKQLSDKGVLIVAKSVKVKR